MTAINRAPIFDAVRQMLTLRKVAPSFTKDEVRLLDGGIDRAIGLPPTPPAASAQIGIRLGLTAADFAAVASALSVPVELVRAVWEVECEGKGWFTDVRGDILALDGPGGFIDGTALPKILFEAHWFAKFTKGRYNLTNPNISSAKWNRKLYVGGQGEWQRLYNAMRLDEEAALMSASVGGPQIMGFNFKLAGFASVREMWDRMKADEASHLTAFGKFVANSGLRGKLAACSTNPETCRPFASGYNGTGYAANNYHVKIAAAVAKWKKLLKGN